ncbi:ADP-ribosylglycohydrolase family protein [uncultured Rubinisphaera sp.]|uniref:ADP-ribosylglycohydrolase family protein n=1 Tax=uncultured Rubinisphaera sp. TaxID=1678686 RepID=UPI0030DD0AE2
MTKSHLRGCILGTAVGDALGLPYEGVSPRRARKMLGSPDRYRFFFRRGMVSDDTELTCLVTQSLITTNFDLETLPQDFARRLRWWFLALPAGIGRATLRACLKLWIGYSPATSGVYSAGNGPAMRAAIIGAVIDDLEDLEMFIWKISRITHTDQKAAFGAIAVALAAYHSRQPKPVNGQKYSDQLKSTIDRWCNGQQEYIEFYKKCNYPCYVKPEQVESERELVNLLQAAVDSVTDKESTMDFALSLGLKKGVTGYTYHTVPVAIHAWLSHPRNYRAAVMSVIECGGDADTTAAIVGGIVGCGVGEEGIPIEWISKLWEWPRSVNWMRRLADQLADSKNHTKPMTPIKLNFIAVLFRNLFFLVIVLLHGFRRLLPPY